jgi:hypothetical protein
MQSRCKFALCHEFDLFSMPLVYVITDHGKILILNIRAGEMKEFVFSKGDICIDLVSFAFNKIMSIEENTYN